MRPANSDLAGLIHILRISLHCLADSAFHVNGPDTDMQVYFYKYLRDFMIIVVLSL